MKAIVNGACGRMGRKIIDLLNSDDNLQPVAGFDRQITSDLPCPCFDSPEKFSGSADVIIDFSNHTAVPALCSYACDKRIPLVVATTGLSDDELDAVAKASKLIPVFFSANTSVGIALLAELARRASAVMPDAEIEIVETHHDQKLDAPSGTALMLADEISSVLPFEPEYTYGRHGHHKRDKSEIGIHSLRLGNVVGIHEIIITNGLETITLKHEAHDRTLLAQGGITAAKFIIGKKAGLYTMKNLLAGE